VAPVDAGRPDEGERDQREERRAAEAAALRILRGAAQSERALLRRLRQRGFSEDAAAVAVSSAASLGYVDDAALASSIVARRRGRRGFAGIVAELHARGVDAEVARDAVSVVSVEEEREAATAEARRRLRGGLSADWEQRRRELSRLAGALSRRGFSGDAVAHALSALGDEATD
jgi:regulatory protein